MGCGAGGCGGSGPIPTGPVGGFGIISNPNLGNGCCAVPVGCRYTLEAYNSMIGRCLAKQSHPCLYTGCIRYWDNMHPGIYATDFGTTGFP